ncbi:MAG TPA: hypothetical protein VMV29_19190 [Ktedonobacterales bacterium]|nr:hypothetical protein [Ktedonobacterales bacterium]
MEPSKTPAKAPHGVSASRPTTPMNELQTHEGTEQATEAFEATIVRIDQAAAEKLFRKAQG